MECRVLGAIEVIDARGRHVALISEAQRRLVAALCLSANSVARSEMLEESLGLSPGALRTSISRLRRVIGAEHLIKRPEGYQLCAAVDAVEFERLVTAAFGSDDAEARRALGDARALWQGRPLAEFGDEPWALVEVQRWKELNAVAMEELAVLLLGTGDAVTAIEVATGLIIEHPYRDLPRALLMRALHQVGRRTEALRAFQSYRRVLADDIGTEPSDMVIELDRAIAGAGDLTHLVEQDHPAWTRQHRSPSAELATPRQNLPIPLSSFVGRAAELACVSELIERHRVVTLAGAGGCGKSRLALRAATVVRERTGVDTWWVDLGMLDSGGDVAEHVAMAIGGAPGRAAVSELARRLSSRPTLLVLDNAEHLIERTAGLLVELLSICPDLRVMVTSRLPMQLTGEVTWRVPPMSMPADGVSLLLDDLEHHDAVRLFVARAREARPGFLIDRHQVAHIVSICRALDGLPLALELAAARARTMPLSVVADDIGQIMGWQGRHRPAQSARPVTLRASIEWSLTRATPIEQQMLSRLSVFRSPFDAEAAAAVANPTDAEGSAPDLLARLTDVGLLQLDDDSGHHRMLHIVRQYCRERDTDAEAWSRLDGAHARWFAHWCAEVGRGRRGIEHGPVVRRMPDIVAALAWARRHDRTLALRICIGLAPIRNALGHSPDVIATWQWLMAEDPARRDRAWAEALAGMVTPAGTLGLDTRSASALLADRPADESRVHAWLERDRALAPAFQGRPDAIRSFADDLIARGEDVESSIYVGLAAHMLALTGRLPESQRLVAELRRLTRRHATMLSVDSVGNGYAAAIVGDTLRGELRAAVQRGARPVPSDPAFSITSAAALAHVAVLASDPITMERARRWSALGTIPLLAHLEPLIACCAAFLAGEIDDAADHAEDFWDLATPVPVSRVHQWPIVNRVLLAAGRRTAAERATEMAAALVGEMDHAPFLLAGVHLAWAQLAFERERMDDVERHARDALAIADGHQFALVAVDALEMLACAWARRGDDRGSAAIIARTSAERRRLGYRHEIVPPQRLLVP